MKAAIVLTPILLALGGCEVQEPSGPLGLRWETWELVKFFGGIPLGLLIAWLNNRLGLSRRARSGVRKVSDKIRRKA